MWAVSNGLISLNCLWAFSKRSSSRSSSSSLSSTATTSKQTNNRTLSHLQMCKVIQHELFMKLSSTAQLGWGRRKVAWVRIRHLIFFSLSRSSCGTRADFSCREYCSRVTAKERWIKFASWKFSRFSKQYGCGIQIHTNTYARRQTHNAVEMWRHLILNAGWGVC
jgi:hypothetical protein